MKMFNKILSCLTAVAVVLITGVIIVGPLTFSDLRSHAQLDKIRRSNDVSPRALQKTELQRYTILWRSKHFVMLNRISKDDRTVLAFESCQYQNCNITYDASDEHKSDAVIFHLYRVNSGLMKVNRPNKQVWILFEDESPDRLGLPGYASTWRKSRWISPFNWSMTYDFTKTDISFPYGELRKRQTFLERNYTEIALQKKHDVIMINSHCSTSSKRERFVRILKKHISVDILGTCGEKWNCGKHRIHDNCFNILNEYRYFLAFENSLCRNYFTEKVFDNFQYDAVIVTRGGLKGDATKILPNGTFISTDRFDSIKSLGKFLKNISVGEYASILRQKDQYFNFGYTSVYKRAMCEVCKRMNNQEKYGKTIPDPAKWMYSDKSCRKPDDIK